MRVAGAQRGATTGLVTTIQEIWAHRELLGFLVRRELKSRYKDSALGFVWSIIRPLVMLLVYYLALGKFLGAARNIDDFAIFIYSGLTLWTLFNEIVTAGTASIVNNSAIIKKVYLPREIFPVSVVGSALFNFAIQLVILLGATVVVGKVPWGPGLLYFPLALLVALTWATALALALSAWNVYLRDVGYLAEVFLMVFFWVSPIVYPWEFVDNVIGGSWLGELYLANPITLAVIGFQQSFWVAGADTAHPDHLAVRLLIALGAGLLALWAGQRVFARLQADFAQEL